MWIMVDLLVVCVLLLPHWASASLAPSGAPLSHGTRASKGQYEVRMIAREGLGLQVKPEASMVRSSDSSLLDKCRDSSANERWFFNTRGMKPFGNGHE